MSLATNIIAYWDLRPNHYSAGVVTDLSGNGHNLTLTAGSLVTTNSASVGPILTVTPYDSLTAVLGKSNIPVYQGGVDLGGKINISSSGTITIVDSGNKYITGTATIGNNTRISITHNPNFFDCVALSANSYFTVNPSILPQLSGKSAFSMGGWIWMNDNNTFNTTMFGGGNANVYGFSLANNSGLFGVNNVISGAATISDGAVPRYPNSFGGAQRLIYEPNNSLYANNGGWQHLFMTYKKGSNGYGTISLYFNGIPVGKNPGVPATGVGGGKVPTLTQPILINANRDISGTVTPASAETQQFLDLGIWGRQLSDDEVFNLYYRNNWNIYPFTKKTITPALTDNLEARWLLNKPDDENLDISHKSYTSTVNGHVLSGQLAKYNSTEVINVPGPMGGALYTSVRLQPPSNGTRELVAGKLDCVMDKSFPVASFSINVWLSITGETGNIFSVRNPANWHKYSISITRSGGFIYVSMKNYLLTGAVSIFDGVLGRIGSGFVNITITFDGTFICYYSNGVFVAKAQVNLNIDRFGVIAPAEENLRIPYKYPEIQIGGSPVRYSDLQVWSRPLSQQEAMTIYNKINSSVTVYVSPSGNNLNNGSRQTPLLSGQRAYELACAAAWDTPAVIQVNSSIPGVTGNYLANGAGISDNVSGYTYKWYLDGDHTSQYVLSCTKLASSPVDRYAWQLINNYDSTVLYSADAMGGTQPDPWRSDWQNINVTKIKDITPAYKNIHFAAGTYSGINTGGHDWNNTISISGEGKDTTILGGVTANSGNNYSVRIFGDNTASGGLEIIGEESGGNIYIVSDNTIDLSFVDSIGGIPVGNGGNIALIGCYVSSGLNTSAQPASLYVDGNGDPIVDPYTTIADDDGLTHSIYPPTNSLSHWGPSIGLAGNIYLKNSTVNGAIYANSYGFNWKHVNGGNIELVDSNHNINLQLENNGNNGGTAGFIKITTTNTGNNSNNGNGALLSQILNLPFSL
jgi:hypothetical protein